MLPYMGFRAAGALLSAGLHKTSGFADAAPIYAGRRLFVTCKTAFTNQEHPCCTLCTSYMRRALLANILHSRNMLCSRNRTPPEKVKTLCPSCSTAKSRGIPFAGREAEQGWEPANSQHQTTQRNLENPVFKTFEASLPPAPLGVPW